MQRRLLGARVRADLRRSISEGICYGASDRNGMDLDRPNHFSKNNRSTLAYTWECGRGNVSEQFVGGETVVQDSTCSSC